MHPGFPAVTVHRKTIRAEHRPLRGARQSVRASYLRLRHPRREAPRLRRRRAAFARQTLLHPHPTSRGTHLKNRRRRKRHDPRRGPCARHFDAGRHPAPHRYDGFSGRHAHRGHRQSVFRRHARVWKPGTLEANRIYVRRQILPAFSGQQIAHITRRDVRHTLVTSPYRLSA